VEHLRWYSGSDIDRYGGLGSPVMDWMERAICSAIGQVPVIPLLQEIAPKSAL